MGKKLFFLSLIFLATVMARDWYINRPKTPKKPKDTPPPVAMNLDDLDIKPSTGSESAGTGEEPPPDDATATDPTDVNASGTESPGENASDTAVASAGSPLEDPIMAQWQALPRNPFEPSPFIKLIAEAQLVSSIDSPGETNKLSKKAIQVLQAPFGATIETEKGFVAVLEQRLFKKGDDYKGRAIRKIDRYTIWLEDASATYIIPKTGIEIHVASDEVSIYDALLKRDVTPGKAGQE